MIAQSATAGDVELILDLVSRGGVLGLLFFVIYGGWKRWWVFRWVIEERDRAYELKAKECDEWKEIALHSVNLAEILNQVRRTETRT